MGYYFDLEDAVWAPFEERIGIRIGGFGRIAFAFTLIIQLLFGAMGTMGMSYGTSSASGQYPRLPGDYVEWLALLIFGVMVLAIGYSLRGLEARTDKARCSGRTYFGFDFTFWASRLHIIVAGVIWMLSSIYLKPYHDMAFTLTLLVGCLFMAHCHSSSMLRRHEEERTVLAPKAKEMKKGAQTPTSASRIVQACMLVKGFFATYGRACIQLTFRLAPVIEVACWIVVAIFPNADLRDAVISKVSIITLALLQLSILYPERASSNLMAGNGSHAAAEATWLKHGIVWILQTLFLAAGFVLRTRFGLKERFVITAPVFIRHSIRCYRDRERVHGGQSSKRRDAKKHTKDVPAPIVTCDLNPQESDNRNLPHFGEVAGPALEQDKINQLGDTGENQHSTLEDTETCGTCTEMLDVFTFALNTSMKQNRAVLEEQHKAIDELCSRIDYLRELDGWNTNTIDNLESKVRYLVRENLDAKAELQKLAIERENSHERNKIADLESRLADIESNRNLAVAELKKHTANLEYLSERQCENIARLRDRLGKAHTRIAVMSDLHREEVRKLNEDLKTCNDAREKEKKNLDEQCNVAWSSAVYHSRHLEAAEDRIRKLQMEIILLKESCLTTHDKEVSLEYVCLGENNCQREDCFCRKLHKEEPQSEATSSPEMSICGDEVPELIHLDGSGNEIENDLIYVSDVVDEEAKSHC